MADEGTLEAPNESYDEGKYALEVHDAPEPVQTDDAMNKLAAVPSDEQLALRDKAQKWVAAVSKLSPMSPEFKTELDAVYGVGTRAVGETTDSSDRFLNMSLAETNPSSSSAQVAKSLADLRETVDDLAPKADTFNSVLSKIPFMKGVRRYFHRFETNQSHLNAIILALTRGQDMLTKDNIALKQDRQKLWAAMGELKRSYEFLTAIDAEVVASAKEARAAGNKDLADALENDLLFAVRQRRQDVQTQAAVAIQAYLSMGIIQQNNDQLIRGVDRAKTTTVMALKTAIQVAQALDNQKLVLDQIDAINRTTDSLISTTSTLLKENSIRVQQQATSSGVSPETLQRAFDNIKDTLHGIDEFRKGANEQFEKTINQLTASLDEMRPYAERQHNGAGEEGAEQSPQALLRGM